MKAIVRIGALTFFAAIFATSAWAQTKAAVTSAPAGGLSLERYEGGSVVTDLGYNIKVNKGSTLKREWFVVRDENAPAYLTNATGIDVSYKSGERGVGGSYRYTVNWTAKMKEPVTAIEIRLAVFDVFGRSLRPLTGTEVEDVADTTTHNTEWRIWSENEASEAYGSVAYVASVRTAAGKVYEINRSALLDQIRKAGKKVSEADLEPPKREPPK